MRQQRFYWAFLVAAIVLTAYGGFSVTRSLTQGKNVSALGVVFLILGIVMLLALLALFLIGRFHKGKETTDVEPAPRREEPRPSGEEPKPAEEPRPVEEPKPERKPAKPPVPEDGSKGEGRKAGNDQQRPVTPEESAQNRRYEDDDDEVEYVRPSPTRRFRGGSAYVRQVGYGAVLRVEGEEILDMRSNTYYRIEGNVVKRSGAGPAFEISGNRIRAAFGSYLYELSGDNVNRVFGGYYASFSGNFLKTHDLSQQYEISGSLSDVQKLAVVALLFGSY